MMGENINVDLYICDNCKKQEIVSNYRHQGVEPKVPNHWYVIVSNYNSREVVCGLKCMRDLAEKRL